MSDTSTLETTVAELTARVADLTAQVEALQDRMNQAHPADQLPEEVAIAISAAVAAYLGKRATVKQVKVRRGGGWAAAARSDIHLSHRKFGSR